MLTRDEEKRLESFFVSDEELAEDHVRGPEFYVSAIRWLSTKLKEAEAEIKELNDENNQLCTENTELVFEMLKMKMRPKDAE
jgi:cell shape-determining protein MreC